MKPNIVSERVVSAPLAQVNLFISSSVVPRCFLFIFTSNRNKLALIVCLKILLNKTL